MGKATLLLVDADQDDNHLLAVHLRAHGYLVIAASTATEALAATVSANLLIAAVKLPDMAGPDLGERLRKRPECIDMPAIFLASPSEDAALGGTAVTKPIYIQELLVRVQLELQRAKRRRIERVEGRARISGSLAELSVADLVQAVRLSGKACVVALDAGGARRGLLFARNGAIVDAHNGPLVGAEAVYRMFHWNEGRFLVDFRPVPRRGRIEMSAEALRLEGLRRQEEWTRLSEQVPPLDDVYEVDFFRLAQCLGNVASEAQTLLRLFDGKRTLEAVIEESELSDLDALTQVEQLVTDGVLVCTAGWDDELINWPERENTERDVRRTSRLARPSGAAQADTAPHAQVASPEKPQEQDAASTRVAPREEMAIPPPSAGHVIPFRRAETQAFVPTANSGTATPAFATAVRPKTHPGVPTAPMIPFAATGESQSQDQDGGQPRRTTTPMPMHASGVPTAAAMPSTDTLVGVIPPVPPGALPFEGVEFAAHVGPPFSTAAPHAKTLPPPEPKLATSPQPAVEAQLPAPVQPPRPKTQPPVGQAEEAPSTEMRFFSPPTDGAESDSLYRMHTSELSQVLQRASASKTKKKVLMIVALGLVGAGLAGYFLFADPYTGRGRFVGRQPSAVAAEPVASTQHPEPVAPPEPAVQVPDVVASSPALPAWVPPVAGTSVAAPSAADPAGDDQALLEAAQADWKRGRGKKALANAEQALQINAQSDQAMALLAILHLDAGRIAKARELALSALVINDQNADAHFALGVVLQESGRGRDAREHYARYLEIDPTGSYAADARAMMR